MKSMYLMGEPVFPKSRGHLPPKFSISCGQFYAARDIARKSISDEKLYNQLALEHGAVTMGLSELEVSFGMSLAHQDIADLRLVMGYKASGCKIIGVPSELPLDVTCFPRDWSHPIHELRVILLSNECFAPGEREKDGVRLIPSPYGVGGRLVRVGIRGIVADRYIPKPRHPILVDKKTSVFRELCGLGLQLVILPPPFNTTFESYQEEPQTFWRSDHVDRSMCLLKDQRGGLHLVLEPNYISGDPQNPRANDESVDLIKRLVEPLEITVHQLMQIRVPYVLNLLQIERGTVLMSSGDDEAAELVASIVGPERVRRTEIPITHYPVYGQAGIRCLIGEVPEVLLLAR